MASPITHKEIRSTPWREAPLRERTEIVLDADFAQIRPALLRLTGWCAARGMEAEALHALETAVAEALNNAVEHGSADAAVDLATVILRWEWSRSWIAVEVVDGSLFLPELPAMLPANTLEERGRGCFLMHRLVTTVTHELRAEGHAVILRKEVGLPREPQGHAETAEILEAMAEELADSYENRAALFSFAEKLATAERFEGFVDAGLKRLRELVGADLGCLRLRTAHGLDLHAAERSTAEGAPGGFGPPLPFHLPEGLACAEWRVLRQNREETIEDCATLAWDDPLRRAGRMVFAVPVAFRDEVFGVLSIGRAQPGAYFTAGQIGLARGMADFIGIARKNALLQQEREERRREERDLEIAAEIQRSLFPAVFPAHDRFEVFGVSHSAFEVGGDYFDALALADGSLLLVVADVMGKGLPAALLANVFRTALHARIDLATRPAALLNEINRLIARDLGTLGTFITAQAAHLSADGSRVELASAGHCPALRFNRAAGRIDPLGGEGPPLGVFADAGITERTCFLAPGDTLLLLTDGLYEVRDPAGRMLDFEGVMHYLLDASVELRPEALCGGLFRFLDRYAGGRPSTDDQTVLAAMPRCR